MTTKRTRLIVGILGAMVLSAPVALAVAQNFIFTNLGGTLNLTQEVPCGPAVTATTSVSDGRMEISLLGATRAFSPLRDEVAALDGGAEFDLTKLDVFFTPFTIRRECLGVAVTVDFREIGVRLVGNVHFTGEAVGGPEDRRYRFSIPKEQVLLFESILDNMPFPQPETAYQRPSEDVTGEIDLRRRSATLHIALATKLHFRFGCVHKKCLVDQVLEGTQTADVEGMVVNPTTDSDNDGVTDLTDNCPLVPNAAQSPIATPVITAPPDITVSACSSPNIGTAQASDVCHGRPVAISNNAPAKFAAGKNLVTWTGRDGIDPPVSAQQVVTVSTADLTPPAVACRVAGPPKGQFVVTMADDCGGRSSLKLGSFALRNGEVIQIQETGKKGVRLINTVSNDNVKHFEVGKGEGVIVATDASGNVARAVCGLPVDITTKR